MKRTRMSGWTVDSGVLLYNGDPRIELHTVTRAHCSYLSRSSSYGIFLASTTQKATVWFGASSKTFSKTGSEILYALQHSAPHVRVHMRGGRLFAGTNFLLGLAMSVAALLLPLGKLFGEPKYGWEVLPVALFLAALGLTMVWLYYPWNAKRFYATPREAARAVKNGGWRAFYRRYG